MKKKILMLLVLIASIFTVQVNAKQFYTSDKIKIEEQQDYSVFAAGKDIDVSSFIDGSTFVAGEDIKIRSSQDIIFAAGKDIKIEECDLKRKRKSYISNLIYMFDDISETNRMIVNNNVLYNDNYTNIYDLIEDMNIDELNEIIKNLDLTNKSICIIKN